MDEKINTYINRLQTNYAEVSSFRQSIISIDESIEDRQNLDEVKEKNYETFNTTNSR